jgi:putative hydrolase of the HAD superfamily
VILVFDLDDTLYDESAFVASGFAAVAAMLEDRLTTPAADLRARMLDLLAEHGRGRVFDLLLAEHGVPDADVAVLVTACVETYRTHRPDITLAPGVRAMLSSLAASGDVAVYLVTDGDPDVQAGKIAALEISPYFRECYRTWSFGREAGKPSLHCFELIRSREDAEWADLAYVGDDPSKDFVGLRAAGARTVRVHTGRFADADAAPGFDADLHVADVTDVPALLGFTGLRG